MSLPRGKRRVQERRNPAAVTSSTSPPNRRAISYRPVLLFPQLVALSKITQGTVKPLTMLRARSHRSTPEIRQSLRVRFNREGHAVNFSNRRAIFVSYVSHQFGYDDESQILKSIRLIFCG